MARNLSELATKIEIQVSCIQDMLEQSNGEFLASYFNKIKQKLDSEYVSRILKAKSEILKREIDKEWDRLIEITDKCHKICAEQKLDAGIVRKAVEKLTKILETEENSDIFNIENEIQILKDSIENSLLANESFLVLLLVSAPNLAEFASQEEKLIIIENGFSPLQIDFLKKKFYQKYNPDYFEYSRRKFGGDFYLNELLDSFLLKLISGMASSNSNVIYIESSEKIEELLLDYNLTNSINAIVRIKNEFDLSYYSFIDSAVLNSKFRLDDFKELTNLKSLKIKNVTNENFDQEITIRVNKLKSLSLHFANRFETKPFMFIGTRNLVMLDLSNNSNIILYSSSFGGLISLQKLSLANCNIKSLDDNIFIELHSLESLNLEKNLNINIKESLADLCSLKELNLSDCNKISFNEKSFSKLNNLESLDLTNCYIVDINLLPVLNSLKRLYLSNCGMILNENSFVGLKNLELLDLSGNHKIELQTRYFKWVKRLKYLSLANCDLKSLQEHIFNELECLEMLDLRNNSNLCTVTNCFSGLPRLKTLDLSYSLNYNERNQYLFVELDNLKSLVLSNSRLNHVHIGFFAGLKNLKELDLSQCGIERLYTNNFWELDELVRLDLSWNFGIHLEMGCFNGLPKLKMLELRSSDVYYVSEVHFTDRDISWLQIDVDKING